MKNLITYTIVFGIALTIGWAFMEAREYFASRGQEAQASDDREWCLIQVMPTAGGQIVSTSAGSHTYRMIATMDGYEVYQKCDELPNAYGDSN